MMCTLAQRSSPANPTKTTSSTPADVDQEAILSNRDNIDGRPGQLLAELMDERS
jgi:hypothetical protein